MPSDQNGWTLKLARMMLEVVVAKLLALLLPALLAAFLTSSRPPDGSGHLVNLVAPDPGNLRDVVKNLVGVIAWQVLASLIVASVFGIFTIGVLWVYRQRAYLLFQTESVRGIARRIFWIFVCAFLVVFAMLAYWNNVSVNILADGPLSAKAKMFIILLDLFCFLFCLFCGWVTIGGIIFALAPSSMRILAAPPLMRSLFRFSLDIL